MWDTTVLTGVAFRYEIAIEDTGCNFLEKTGERTAKEDMPPKRTPNLLAKRVNLVS